MIRNIILVALGGAIGSAARYLVSLLMQRNIEAFPWQTFTVNITGCFLIGLLFCYNESASSDMIRFFLMAGVLGGFTTFSSFGLEAFSLIRQQLIPLAVIYMISSQLAGLLFVFLGYLAGKQLT